VLGFKLYPKEGFHGNLETPLDLPLLIPLGSVVDLEFFKGRF